MYNNALSELNIGNSGKTYAKFNPADDILTNQKETVTVGLWSNDVGTLQSFFTSSTQTATQKTYYYEVFNSASTGATAEPQFSVVYGSRVGSGSLFVGNDADSPTKAIYSQYRLLLLDPTDTTFTFNGTNSDSIYAINIQRNRLKEKLDVGNMELWLAPLSGSGFANASHTGSAVQLNSAASTIKLIDDSGDANGTLTSAGSVYNIVSGTIATGTYTTGGSAVYYGLSYPNLGIIILNGDTLNANLGFNTVSGSNIAGDNAYKLFVSISGAADLSTSTSGFTARSSETVASNYYFCRVKNQEFNYSNNPTFVTGSQGDLSQATFVTDPKTYITTVGLYNDRQELLAVAKTSQPIQKSFWKEALIKVKLTF